MVSGCLSGRWTRCLFLKKLELLMWEELHRTVRRSCFYLLLPTPHHWLSNIFLQNIWTHTLGGKIKFWMRENTFETFSVVFVYFCLPHLLSYLVRMFAYIFSGYLKVGDKWFKFRKLTQGLGL